MTAPIANAAAPTVPRVAQRAARQNASKRQLVRNFATGYLSLGIAVVFSFLFTPIALHHLGQSDYGLWIIIVTVGTYVGLLEAGVGVAALRTVAAEKALGREDRVAETLATARAFFLVSGLAAIGVSGLLLPFVGVIFNVHGNTLSSARWGLLLMSVSCAASSLVSVPRAALSGSGRSSTMGLITLVTAIAVQIGQITALLSGGGIVALTAITAVGGFVTYVTARRAAKHLGLFRVRGARPTRAMLRELTVAGTHNLALSLSGTLIYGFDTVMIGAILPVGQVAPYDIALSTNNFIGNASTAGTDLMVPTYAHSAALEDRERQFNLFCASVLGSMALTIPMVIALIGFGPPLLHLWLGNVPRHTYEILVVMNLLFLFHLPGHQAAVFLTGVGKNRLLGRMMMPAAIVTIGLSVAATFWLGPVGPVVGNLPLMAGLEFVVLPILCCRVLGTPYRRYIRSALLPLLAPLGTASALVGFLLWTIGTGRTGWVPIEAVTVVVVGLAVSVPVMVRIDPTLRGQIQTLLTVVRALLPTAAAWARKILGIGIAVGIPAVLGAVVASGTHQRYALLGGIAVLAVGLLTFDLRALAVLAVPSALIAFRVGSGSSGLAVGDLVLFLATLAALRAFSLRDAPEVGRLLTYLGIYEAAVFLTVVYNPYRANIVEWVHEAFLVGGALIVGWVVGRAGKAGSALGAYVFLACVVAFWACFEAVAKHFQPAYLPFGMQKNFIGDMLAFAVVVLYANPPWLGWRGRWTRAALLICLLGIMASQSKQAMIATVLGVIVIALRAKKLGGRSRSVVLAMVPIAAVAYEAVSKEFQSTNQFNSVHQRQTWFNQSFNIWHHSEWFGVGLRWWYTTRFADRFQPPNAEFEMLTSAGLVGVAALLVLLIGALRTLWKVPARWGTLAFTILLMRVIQGQLDIFWVTGQGSFPWIVAGICLGVMALEKAESPLLVAP